jgi:hypothetical protein
MNKKNIIFLIVLIKYVKSNDDDEGEPTYDSPLSIDCTC